MIFKTLQNHFLTILLISLLTLNSSCSNDDDRGNNDIENPDETGEEDHGGCFIELFDGDNFKDDHLKVEGPADYADLSDLPNADGFDWTDEADSFKVSKGATVTIWTATHFKGDSTVYDSGDYPSENEPNSLKIKCNKNGKD